MFLKVKAHPGVFIDKRLPLGSAFSPSCVEKDFFYNLTLVSSVYFGELDENLSKGKQWLEVGGCKFINFSGLTTDYNDPRELTLVFTKEAEGEYQRMLRIVEGDTSN